MDVKTIPHVNIQLAKDFLCILTTKNCPAVFCRVILIQEKANAMAKKKSLYSAEGATFPFDLNVDAWLEMVEHRQELGNPYTDLGAKKAINKLAKYPHDVQQKAVDRAIEGGWTGVFPDKEISSESSTSIVERMGDTSWASGMVSEEISIN